MKPRAALLGLGLVSAAAAAHAGGNGLALAPEDIAPPYQPLAEVAEVTVERAEDGEALRITVSGQANTGGWLNPRLARLDGLQGLPPGPEDIATFAFVGRPPVGMATQAFTPIEARALWLRPPRGLRGVRVLAQEGCAGAWVEAEATGDPCEGLGG